ncbi:MAG: Zn-dependent hydrolase [Balneolaceae bacterium]|nr:Zn-dependent hydrolase [Balneolaceae bacterium]
MKSKLFYSIFVTTILLISCTGETSPPQTEQDMSIEERLDQYTSFRLTADLSVLSDNQRKMLPILIEASEAMDRVFWQQAYGEKDRLRSMIEDSSTWRFAEINYGPWDRLNGNEPFVEGVGPKPAGANFYPPDMNREEFEAWESEDKDDLYTLVRRSEGGELMTIPYHEAFSEEHELAAGKLKEAARLAGDPGLKTYLELRAEALLTDEYQASDMTWLDMKNNLIDVIIGPIETYEDQMYGYKAAHEAFVLLKDRAWSDRLSKYAEVLPDLQEGLPVPEEYKQETPGRDSELNAYEVLYYAGDSNAGSKTIAINLPNDEEVQLKKGTRRLQLKNAMRAKYDKILVPKSEVLIAEDQRSYITFDAFFGNTMFHEVVHGLGIKNTITGKGTVREALKDHASAIEEGKADVLGLYMVSKLRDEGMVTDGSIEDNYVTFMASIFRSIRFGSSSAHGRANLIRFNFFREQGAFTYDESSQTYRVDMENMAKATDALSRKILMLQGDGDYEAVSAFVAEYAVVSDQLQQSLDRLREQSIPVDVTFEQGLDVLGLETD